MYVWGITDVGLVRQENQDAYYYQVEGEQAVCLVCDGMGGARAGNIASRIAAETFVSVVEEKNEDSPGNRLSQALEAANSAVFHKASQEPEYRGMGTTLVAAIVAGTTAHVINVGDSRAYYVTPNGIEQITRDHSLVGDLVARGEITPQEARMHPNKNLITRALGAESTVRGDQFRREMEPGSSLLLCSDGLSNLLEDQELLYEVIHGGEPETCCGRLLKIALDRGAPDNVTAVLLCMDSEECE